MRIRRREGERGMRNFCAIVIFPQESPVMVETVFSVHNGRLKVSSLQLGVPLLRPTGSSTTADGPRDALPVKNLVNCCTTATTSCTTARTVVLY